MKILAETVYADVSISDKKYGVTPVAAVMLYRDNELFLAVVSKDALEVVPLDLIDGHIEYKSVLVDVNRDYADVIVMNSKQVFRIVSKIDHVEIVAEPSKEVFEDLGY